VLQAWARGGHAFECTPRRKNDQKRGRAFKGERRIRVCSFARRVPPALSPPAWASAAPNCGGWPRSPANSPTWPAARIRRPGPGSTWHTMTSHALKLRGQHTTLTLRGRHAL